MKFFVFVVLALLSLSYAATLHVSAKKKAVSVGTAVKARIDENAFCGCKCSATRKAKRRQRRQCKRNPTCSMDDCVTKRGNKGFACCPPPPPSPEASE